MHRMLQIWQEVPRSPKCKHFLRAAQRDTYVRVHGGDVASNQDIVLEEIPDYLLSGMKGIHHHKVGMRIDGFMRTSHSLIEKFLTVILSSQNKAAYAIGIIESRCGGPSDEG